MTDVAAMAADRIAGLRYKQIAEKHGTSVPMVRRYLKKAMEGGHVSAEAIRYKPSTRVVSKIPDSEYNAQWMAKVMSRVDFDRSGCWLWKGPIGDWGYAYASYRGRHTAIHRRVYQIVHSVKLDRWQLVRHKCDTPHCVNPAHLELGTPAQNVQDAADRGRHHNARKTVCKRGHSLEGDNLWICSQGLRHCKACARGRQRLKTPGWTEERAYSEPAIPFNEPTPTRVWAKGKV